VAASTPLVVAIDDLQWMDLPSVRALQFVVRRLK
jgi:predicted ATPase